MINLFYKVISNEVINFKKKLKIKNRLDPSFKDRKFTLGGSSECCFRILNLLKKAL